MTTEQILATTLALERLQRYADERAQRLAQYTLNWQRRWDRLSTHGDACPFAAYGTPFDHYPEDCPCR